MESRRLSLSRRGDRVTSLTGLRAVAALLIVGTHAAYGTGQLSNSYLGTLYARLEVGVPIFFVLSGFLLFRPWVRAAADGAPPPSLRRYAFRRIRRIAPAYLVVVLLAYAVYQFRDAGPNPGHTWKGLLEHLTLTQIYEPVYFYVMHQGLTQTWSLAVEFAFYAVLPLLGVLCRGTWRPRLVLAGLGCLAAITPAWLSLQHGTDWLPTSAGMWLPAHLLYFAGGMTLAVLQVIGARVPPLIAGVVAVLGYLIVSTPIAGDVTTGDAALWQTMVKVALYAAIACAAVAALVLVDGNGYDRLLNSAPLVWLGEISYEVFLLHVIAMEIVMASVLDWPVFTGSWAVVFAVTLAMTVPPAWLLHRWTRPACAGHRPDREHAAVDRPRIRPRLIASVAMGRANA
ncbi:acyltransferase family protein [Mycolicibacterium gadium]|uniref:Acyltransferase n=1 Tax=Mycolicibacterium gadium TaxID=1794 RepID=A0ABT6GY62_MYCGU|nr:acyltransferase [Mycolicibacterium gadium]MDG5486122.1 acyltransferase [Mycolicibacterium gadium]